MTDATETKGAQMYAWIVAALERGATVYICTYTRAWKLSRKHLGMIRLRNGHCELQHGKRWDIIDLCAVTATE